MKSVISNIKIYTVRSKWTILFVLIVITTILLFNNGRIQLEVFGAILGSTITAYFGILKQSIEGDQVFRELFTTFNARYSDETNDLLNRLRIDHDKEPTLSSKEKYLIELL